MAGVYSTLFYKGAINTSTVTAYTVPDGFVAVLRCIDVHNAAGGSNVIQVYDVDDGHGWAGTTLAADEYFLWRGRQVMAAGDELGLQASANFGYFRVSGYLLDTG